MRGHVLNGERREGSAGRAVNDCGVGGGNVSWEINLNCKIKGKKKKRKRSGGGEAGRAVLRADTHLQGCLDPQTTLMHPPPPFGGGVGFYHVSCIVFAKGICVGPPGTPQQAEPAQGARA